MIASTLPSGNLISQKNMKLDEFASEKEYLYVPHLVPNIMGLHDRIVYFNVTPGPDNACKQDNNILFIEPRTENYHHENYSRSDSFYSMKRSYTPIYLDAQSSNYEDVYQRQGSHVPS